MSSSGSNVHSLTASKAKKKGKEKRCLCDRPSNLNRPANDNCRDTLLTTDMGTRGKKRSRLHSTSSSLFHVFRQRNPVRVVHTHTPVEVKSGTHTKQAKENRCLLSEFSDLSSSPGVESMRPQRPITIHDNCWGWAWATTTIIIYYSTPGVVGDCHLCGCRIERKRPGNR
jgi:hypothetical protein